MRPGPPCSGQARPSSAPATQGLGACVLADTDGNPIGLRGALARSSSEPGRGGLGNGLPALLGRAGRFRGDRLWRAGCGLVVRAEQGVLEFLKDQRGDHHDHGDRDRCAPLQCHDPCPSPFSGVQMVCGVGRSERAGIKGRAPLIPRQRCPAGATGLDDQTLRCAVNGSVPGWVRCSPRSIRAGSSPWLFFCGLKVSCSWLRSPSHAVTRKLTPSMASKVVNA